MYDELLEDFKNWITTDKKIQKYWDKVASGKANYFDATEYSRLIGDKWSNLLKRVDDEDIEEFIDSIKGALNKTYSESAYYSKNVQENINTRSNIGLKVKEPKLDESRVSNLIDKIREKPGAKWLVGKSVVDNISRSAVTDTIEYNARFQSDAGLYSYIERVANNCCDWCNSLSGRYIYGEQPDDFFAVHKDCSCTITYTPSRNPKIKYGR